MATFTSTRTPGAASSVDSGQYNDPSWNSVADAVTQNGSGAYTFLWSNPYEDSDYLRLTQYGFNLPADTTGITGISVRVRTYRSGGDINYSYSVYLMKNGSSHVGSPQWQGSLPTSYADITFGNSTQLWGTTWTRSEINASGFGVSIRAGGPSSGWSSTLYIDVVEVTVYYTAPGPSSVDRGIRITGQSLDSKAQDVRLTGYFPSAQRDITIKGFSTSSRSQGLYVECTVHASNHSQDVRIFGQGASDRWQNLRLNGESLSSRAQEFYLEGILGSSVSTDLRIVGRADSSRANDLRIVGVIPSSVDRDIKMEGIGDTSSSDRMLKTSGALGMTTNRNVAVTGQMNSSISTSLKIKGRGDQHSDRYRPREFRIGEWILRFGRSRRR